MEYMVLQVNWGTPLGGEELSKYGGEGWRLHTVIPDNSDRTELTYIFERAA